MKKIIKRRTYKLEVLCQATSMWVQAKKRDWCGKKKKITNFSYNRPDLNNWKVFIWHINFTYKLYLIHLFITQCILLKCFSNKRCTITRLMNECVDSKTVPAEPDHCKWPSAWPGINYNALVAPASFHRMSEEMLGAPNCFSTRTVCSFAELKFSCESLLCRLLSSTLNHLGAICWGLWLSFFIFPLKQRDVRCWK